jgi:hypothetical protein
MKSTPEPVEMPETEPRTYRVEMSNEAGEHAIAIHEGVRPIVSPDGALILVDEDTREVEYVYAGGWWLRVERV